MRGREPSPRPAAATAGGIGSGVGKVQRIAGFDHGVRMPLRGCTADRLGRRAWWPQAAVRRTRGRAVVVRRPCRRSSQSCQSTSSGLATKIDE